MEKRVAVPRRSQASKRWKKIFSQDRDYRDKLYFESRAAPTEDEKQVVDSFFEEYETTIPSWELRVVRRFFKAAKPGPALNQDQARAKLDDRDHQSQLKRAYPPWLTPQALRESLDIERFNCSVNKHRNADRRLIYIHGLTPEYVVALVRTAHSDQVQALRETIWKHIAYEASLRVVIPLDGFAIFRLEFHLPFLTLRHFGGTVKDHVACKNRSVAQRWSDLSFLDIECLESHEGSCRFVIEDAAVSIVICGHDHKKWVGWGLSNTPGDPTTYEEECGLEEDFFATDGNGPEEGLVVDSNSPEWDPRKYWLRNVEIRVRMALHEWRFLVFSVEDSVQDWKDKHRISRSTDTGHGDRSELKELFEWTVETMQLLRKLNERFAKTNQLWARFNAHDGDRGYFADMRDPRVICMLSSLKNSFEEMSDLKKKLSQLKKSCNESQQLLSLHLEHDSHLATSDTREFSRRAQEYNLETVRMSHNMYKLNRKSTEAAEATTHTTRINVQLFLITTPFFLALQYFGAEKDIFSFNRSPKTFGITCAILLCALPLAMCILGYANKFWYEYMRRESRKNIEDDDEGCDKVDV